MLFLQARKSFEAFIKQANQTANDIVQSNNQLALSMDNQIATILGHVITSTSSDGTKTVTTRSGSANGQYKVVFYALEVIGALALVHLMVLNLFGLGFSMNLRISGVFVYTKNQMVLPFEKYSQISFPGYSQVEGFKSLSYLIN